MFELDRTFSQRCAETGLMKWYFNAREGIYGPYNTKQRATDELKIFIERRKCAEDDGGRVHVKNKNKLTIAPIEFSIEPKIFDPTKKKKGLEDL